MRAIRSIYDSVLILLAAGLLAGCHRADPERPHSDGTITFRISDQWQLGTRSLANNEDDIKAKPFVVLGKYSAGDTYKATALSPVFDNQPITFTAETGWDYSPKQFWTRSSTHRFCAYWPQTAGTTISGDLYSTISINNFSVAPDLASQGDLLLSNVREQFVDSNPRQMSEQAGYMVHNGIALQFRHLLTNIRFSVAKTKTNTADVKVTNVRIYNVKNTSTFTTTSTDGITWSPGTWQQPTGSVVYNSGTISKDVAVANFNDETTAWEWNASETAQNNGLLGDGFVVIPQTINQTGVTAADKVYVTIEYSSTPTGGSATVRRVTADFPISDAGQVWQMYKRITYKLLINEDNFIKFGKPSVESWGTAQTSGTIIIK